MKTLKRPPLLHQCKPYQNGGLLREQVQFLGWTPSSLLHL
jgi:hypothetical protein